MKIDKVGDKQSFLTFKFLIIYCDTLKPIHSTLPIYNINNLAVFPVANPRYHC